MQLLATKLINLPIISLQTGDTIGVTTTSIVDPAKLKLVAFRCLAGKEYTKPIVMMTDIREIAVDCLVVNSDDSLSEADDIVRLGPLLKENHTLMNKRVVTEAGRGLGSIEDFILDSETIEVLKLYVKPKLIRSWLGSTHIVDRSQIIDVTPKHVVVKEATVVVPLAAAAAAIETQP